MANRVTIQDIADALGVSRNTVSKAINNTGILADATREKVLQKAVEMGYKQFSYVSLTQNPYKGTEAFIPGLQTESTPPVSHGIISLLTTTTLTNSHFSSTMLDKMHRELAQLGYSLTIHRVTSDDIRSMKLPNSFVRDQNDAVICIEIFDYAYSCMICNLGLPTLFIDSPVTCFSDPLKTDMLIMDNRSQIYSFVNEMKKRGLTKIGFIGDYMHCTSFFERYMAFRESITLLGLPFNADFCLLGSEKDYLPHENYSAYLGSGLKAMKTLPDVFICANDFVAVDTLVKCRELDISVPEDVRLCGFDDSPESRIVTPQLTTIHIHSQVMGFSAVQLLISRIKNPSMNYRTIYTETSLLFRESTGDGYK